MQPHWTKYNLEILLLTAAAMAVGAHLNHKVCLQRKKELTIAAEADG